MKSLKFIEPIARFISKASARLMATILAGQSGVACSLIIVTRDQSSYLSLLLASIENQTFPSEKLEIVLINNSSRDNTSDILDYYASHSCLRILRHDLRERSTIAGALNLAITVAHGNIIVFVRDDYLLDSNFVLRHLAHHVRANCLVIGNSKRYVHTHLFSLLDPAMQGVSPTVVLEPEGLKNINRLTALSFDSPASVGNQGPLWTRLEASNMSVRREQIEHVGALDENLPDGEHTRWELAYRLYKRNINIHIEPEAIALQQFRPFNPIPQPEWRSILSAISYRHPELDSEMLQLIIVR